MKKRNITKLVATIVSMVSALCLLAVGVFATLTNFQVAIANQLNLKFDAVEGTLYATRVGDVAGTDRTTSKVLSESTTATDWLKVYDGTTTEGVQNDALTSIQEKVDFISNDKIKEKVNAGTTSIAITYYFYYNLPADAVANNITLTAPAVTDSNVVVSYSYTKTTSATLPAFTDATTLNNGSVVTVSGGEHLFIKAEAKVDLSKSVKIENADWQFTLDFGISTYSLTNDTLTFNSVTGAETYEVWAKQNTTSGASLIAQTSAVGDTDATLGTLVKILDKTATSVDLADALSGQATGEYTVTVLPKNSSGVEIADSRITASFTRSLSKLEIKVTDEAINGNYYYYVELGEYPQSVVSDTTLVSSLNALTSSAKTGKQYQNGTTKIDGSSARIFDEYVYNGARYVKVTALLCEDYSSSLKLFTDGTTATSGSSYWFKVEPLKWFLLEAYSPTKTEYTGTKTNVRLISEKVLTANIIKGYDTKDTSSTSANASLLASNNLSVGAPHGTTTWSADWSKSNIRAWLNSEFFNQAFVADEQEHLVTNLTRYNSVNNFTTQDDYLATSSEFSAEDKVWLASRYELQNTYAKDNYYIKANTVGAVPTDYAIANKSAYMKTSNNVYYSYYNCRNYNDSNYCLSIVECNYIDNFDCNCVETLSVGLRPVITINL